jgi:aldose 1-epimerase
MNLIEICHPDSGDMIRVDADFGAQLTKLVLNGQSLLKYPVKETDPKKGYPSDFLFPYSNRVKDGKFTFNGEVYQLEINDPESNCAMHGLVAFEKFEVIEQTENSVFLMHNYNGGGKGYPFPFRFGVEYVLSPGHLEVRTGVKNTGTRPLPFSFGWHPYFGFGDESIGNMTIGLPQRRFIELDERMIPIGTTSLLESEELSLRNMMLDNVFEISQKGEFSELGLKFQGKVLKLEQKTGEHGLNYFVLYTPPGRNCIAIEPQTANIDALNNSEGLIVLESGKSRSFIIRISF